MYWARFYWYMVELFSMHVVFIIYNLHTFDNWRDQTKQTGRGTHSRKKIPQPNGENHLRCDSQATELVVEKK